ncbi:MAG: type II toxin-antitoxin system RelE/ParE family toxin [Thermoplasmata archaeon]
MYEILLSKTALRQLRRLPADIEQHMREKMRVLADDPFHSRSGADIRLVWSHEEPRLYRLRIGEYRVLYFVVGNEVRVTEILHRSRAYRGLE